MSSILEVADDNINMKRTKNDEVMRATNEATKKTATPYAIRTAHLNVFLYSTLFWIQTMTLPYLSKKLNVDLIIFGYIRTTFALMQLAGGPIFGRFGDIFGSRSAMVLAFSSSAVSYFLTGIAVNVPMLFLSRLPSVFMHGMQGSQMIVIDMADPSTRVDALGKVGMSYGVGMIVGPLFGGWITKFLGERVACHIAAVGCLLSVCVVFYFVPHHDKSTHKDKNTNVFSISKLWELIYKPDVLFLLLIKTVSGIPLGILQSMISIVALETFHFTPEQNGYLMAYIGILGMLIQGFGVGYLTKRFSDVAVLRLSALILMVAYLLLTSSLSVPVLLVSMIPLVAGMCLISIVISSSLTNAVPHSDTGAILGVNMGIHSLIRSISPTVGGYMLVSYGFRSIGLLGFITSCLVLVVLLTKYKR